MTSLSPGREPFGDAYEAEIALDYQPRLST